MIVKVQSITQAVKSTVPPQMWGEIAEKLQELEHHHSEALYIGTDSVDDDDDDDDEPFDPTECIDEDDEEF